MDKVTDVNLYNPQVDQPTMVVNGKQYAVTAVQLRLVKLVRNRKKYTLIQNAQTFEWKLSKGFEEGVKANFGDEET